jgi:hypothetical protein
MAQCLHCLVDVYSDDNPSGFADSALSLFMLGLQPSKSCLLLHVLVTFITMTSSGCLQSIQVRSLCSSYSCFKLEIGKYTRKPDFPSLSRISSQACLVDRVRQESHRTCIYHNALLAHQSRLTNAAFFGKLLRLSHMSLTCGVAPLKSDRDFERGLAAYVNDIGTTR